MAWVNHMVAWVRCAACLPISCRPSSCVTHTEHGRSAEAPQLRAAATAHLVLSVCHAAMPVHRPECRLPHTQPGSFRHCGLAGGAVSTST
eukprot:5981034-Prymnesium_polylepis.1